MVRLTIFTKRKFIQRTSRRIPSNRCTQQGEPARHQNFFFLKLRLFFRLCREMHACTTDRTSVRRWGFMAPRSQQLTVYAIVVLLYMSLCTVSALVPSSVSSSQSTRIFKDLQCPCPATKLAHLQGMCQDFSSLPNYLFTFRLRGGGKKGKDSDEDSDDVSGDE